MPSVEKISIVLPPEMAALVRRAVESGEYASSSEVIRDALRDWTRKRRPKQVGLQQLREMWAEAITDSRPGKPMKEVMDTLERKYQAMANERALQKGVRKTSR